MRIAILGGGVAGVVLAKELADSDAFTIDLYEQNDALGGLHRSVEIDGAHYDIGAFLFDREHALLQTFPFLYDHFVPIEHRSLVLTQRKTLDIYPMSMRGYLRDHSAASLAADAVSLLAAKLVDRRRDSLRSFVHYYLGPRIYRRSGLKAYIERFYAVPDSEVDLEFAMQRLDALPEACGLRRNVGRIAREAFDASTMEKTWGCYVRPPGGFPFAYKLIEESLTKQGVDIRFNAAIERIEKDGERFVLKMREGADESYDLVVSTIPVGIMMRLIGRPMERPPQAIQLISLCYRFRGDLGFSNATMLYNFTYDALWKRLSLFSPIYGTVDGDDYFVVECTRRLDDPNGEEEMRRSFEDHVATLPVLNGSLDYRRALVTNNAYPYFRKEDLAGTENAKGILAEFGIAVTGRQGGFRYMTAHKTALAARELAQRLTAAEDGALA